jgi:PKD repeat protein
VAIIQTTPAPMTTSPTGNVTSCTDSVIITAVNGFASYTWSTNETTQTIEVNTTGEYTVSGQDANGCTSVSPPINVTIDSGPPALISINPAGPISFCTGSPVTLVAQAGFQNYVWSTSQTGASIVVNASGTYSVTAESNSGCPAESGEVVITEIDVPLASFTYEQPSGYTVLFTNTTAYGGTFLWDFGAGITVTQESPSFTFPFDGAYDVTLIATNACGADTITVSVEVKKIIGFQDISKELGAAHLLSNPARGFACLQGETTFQQNYSVKIIDGLGREIRCESFQVLGSWVKNIDLSNETKGIYWLVLEDSGNHRSVKKLILL